MIFLCLAYGDEKDWNALGREQQEELLAADERLRQRGALIAAVRQEVTTVRAWEGVPVVSAGPIGSPSLPLAGFSVIEAANLEEAINLVAATPCARAKGAIEIRPLLTINDVEWAAHRSSKRD
jgi:hypothetical protein